jgi:hypothetical protein
VNVTSGKEEKAYQRRSSARVSDEMPAPPLPSGKANTVTMVL